MFRRFTLFAIIALAMAALMVGSLAAPSPASANGAVQIEGMGVYASPGDCTDPEGAGSDYALLLTGALEGCHYAWVESAVCSPSGTYRERGTEVFVGTYNGEEGTFATTYAFEAKFDDCANVVGEIFGRCQHPIIAGSGTGIFDDVTGRLDFKDDVEANNFPYRGHLH